MTDETLVWRTEVSGRLDVVLAKGVEGCSRSRLAQLVREGAVSVDGAVVQRPSASVAEGAELCLVFPPPKPLEAIAQDLPVDIVHEEEHFLVVNKASGMVVHPGPGHADGTLVNALLHHVRDLSAIGGVERPGIVHRLDRGTSGLLVVAKSDLAHQALSAQFRERSAGRHYLAICHSPPLNNAGTHRTSLARHPSDRLRWASTERGGKPAITHWNVRGRAGTLGLLECRLETGRTHQIRVHLTELGHPIVGDDVYKRRGNRVPATVRSAVGEVARPLLHAWRLYFNHPKTKEPCLFQAELPADMREVLAALALSEPKEPAL